MRSQKEAKGGLKMDRGNVKKGIGLLFWGNILGLFILIPFVGVFMVIAAFIIELIGLWGLRKEDENYNTAFFLMVIGVIIGLFSGGDGAFSSLMKLLESAASLGATYMICTATSSCVAPYASDVADYCISVRTWYVTCMAISIAINLIVLVFSIIPVLGWIVAALGSVAAVIVAIFQLVASIRYLIMLWKCQGVL